MTKLIVAITFLAFNAYVYNWMARSSIIPERHSFESFPLELGDWKCVSPQSIEPDVLRNLGATDYLVCDFEDSQNRNVSFYAGYHATQIREEGGGAKENAIHPPAHCLPGSGWDIIASDSVPLALPTLPPDATAKRLIIAKGEMRQLVYYWYQSRGRVISEDWQKVLYVGVDRALRGRTDGALVRFTVPIRERDEDEAEETFRDIAPRIVEKLGRHVPI